MKNIIVAILTLFFFVNFTCTQKETPLDNENKDEIIENDNEDGTDLDYIIYSHVLNYLCEQLNFSKILLSDSTLYCDISNRYEYVQGHLDSIEVETIDDYLSRNSEKIRLHEIDSLNFECILYTPNDTSDWRDSYPDAYAVYHLSCVGYNEEKTQALVYYWEYYAPLSGIGVLVYLEYKDCWKVKEGLLVIIA